MSAIEFIDLTQDKAVSTMDFEVRDRKGVRYRKEYECWAIVERNGWINFNLSWPECRSGGANFVLRLCSATVQGVSDCPVEVSVNGNVIVSDFDPHIYNYYNRAWYIPERLLKPSENEVIFRLKEGRTQVFIQKAWIVQYDRSNQKLGQWCWAAVATSVARYYRPGSSWTQEKIVADTWKKNIDGPLGKAMKNIAKKCNQTQSLEEKSYDNIDAPSFVNLALRTTGNLRLCMGFEVDNVPEKLEKAFGKDILWRPLTFEELQNEASNMSPVIVCMKFEFGNHFVVVTGVSDSARVADQMVAVQDPLEGYKYMTYEAFKTKYLGIGIWNYTCLTQRRRGKGIH